MPKRESELGPDAASYLVLAYFRETNAESSRISGRLDQAVTAAKSSDASAIRAFRDCVGRLSSSSFSRFIPMNFRVTSLNTHLIQQVFF